ncbi:phosphotransferase family protein [Streptantibioticus silvisoli]|uniref:Aminoglycoside phosphotransferase family protein n=1 Tax=Streptantibioticus silvisoli TaxID=2705255 RepID=A0ABT6VVU1_9ACTN|nr:aminoglycoside phosphotransferase family protein [Streptantibioticus silvisoli]MDI5962260.1 aminoglycoside phosphotransferase family protein [Streptantibioticus silvisoli]
MSDVLTVESAGGLLTGLLPAYGSVRAVTRFAEGSVTGAYRVDFAAAGTAPVVVKVHGRDDLVSAVREARALRFLTRHGIDVSPRVLAFSRCAELLGDRPCVVSSLRPGRTLTTVDDELTPAQRHDVYRQVGEVLRRLHAVPAPGYGYLAAGDPGHADGAVRTALPDNRAHMARVFDRELRRFRANGADPALVNALAGHVADRAEAFAACPRPAYCHGDVHEPNLLVEPAGDDRCSLTGLIDPLNMHAGDPLTDFVRLDAFSLQGDPTKIAGLLSGYGAHEAATHPGAWPVAWRPRLHLYRIALAVELHNWFTISGQRDELPALDRQLRELVGAGERRG